MYGTVVSAAAAAVFLLGLFSLVALCFFLLLRPKKGETVCRVLLLGPGEKNAAARVGYQLVCASLFGRGHAPVIAALAPGAEGLRAELKAAFGETGGLFICREEELTEIIRRSTEKRT